MSNTKLRIPQVVALLGLTVLITGCSTLSGVPVSRVPREILYTEKKDDFQDISLLRLRRNAPDAYRLGPGDTLAVYVPELVGYEKITEGREVTITYEVPRFNKLAREDQSERGITGIPYVVDDDGVLRLPLVGAVNVQGLTVPEATAAVIQKALENTTGIEEKLKGTTVGLVEKRKIQVLVIREEDGGVENVTKRGSGETVYLAADENDLLHALNETGGLPGLDAQNEVLIYRGLFEEGEKYDHLLNSVGAQNCGGDSCFCDESPLPDPPTVTRIPLRYHPTRPPEFDEEDITLSDRDIIIIRSRDRETFYTAGLLGGGEYALPRDKDLDILGAIAMAGGPLGQIGTGVGGIGGNGGSGGGRAGGYCQPSDCFVIRDLPCGDQITLKVDLERALEDPAQRILIKPGDVVLLKYKLREEVANVVLGLLQFNVLFNGSNGGF